MFFWVELLNATQS